MAKSKFKYVPNRKATADVALRGPGVEQMLKDAATRAAPEGTEVETFQGKTRVRATIFDPDPRAMARESTEGHLSRALGQVHT